MVRNLAETISNEYIGRFLIELIQNGYDAHPAGTTGGEIEIYLDPDEGLQSRVDWRCRTLG